MRWQLGRRSENVEDRRGSTLAGGGLKIGGLGLIIVVVISLLTGKNPLKILGLVLEQQQTSQVNLPTPGQGGPPANDEQKEFMSTVLADTEDTWSQLFQQMGLPTRSQDLSCFPMPCSPHAGQTIPQWDRSIAL